MAKVNNPIVAFNAGEIGKESIARTTLEIYPNTASILENFLVETTGPMAFRPGWAYRNNITNDPKAYLRRFIFNEEQAYLLIFTENQLRVAQSGNVIVRQTVNCTVADGEFAALTGWTNISVGGTTAAIVSGALRLTGNGTAAAGVRQTVTTSSVGVRHALDIHVSRGPVTFRVGSVVDSDDLVMETTLRTGYHSLAFTPGAATFVIEFTSDANASRDVAYCRIAPAGDLVLPTNLSEPEIDARIMKFQQSNDVLYMTTGKGPIMRIERRAADSWSIAETFITDGPFLAPNIDDKKTLRPTVATGNGQLIANHKRFKAGHVGSLWTLTHQGQRVEQVLTGEDQNSDAILVISTTRNFSIEITGAFAGKITLKQSVGNENNYVEVASYTGATTTSYADSFNNQNIYYKIGFSAGDYTSGSATVRLTYPYGTTIGKCRVTEYVSETTANMEVIDTFGAIEATQDWSEGAWSDEQYWPSSIAIHDGRMYVADADLFWGSIAGSYESFKDGDTDSSAISRSIATGDMSSVRWLLSLTRFNVATGGANAVIAANALDEAITPANVSVKEFASVGASNIEPGKVDTRSVFVSREGKRVYQTKFNVEIRDYDADPLMGLHKRLGRPGISQIAVSRAPDTRVWFVRTDGQLLCLLFDAKQNAIGWQRIITDGVIESCEALPGEEDDEIYIWVRRTIGGQQRRMLEQLGPLLLEKASDACPVDSYIRYEGTTGITELTGLDHLEGRTLVVWTDGYLHPDRVVTGGKITLKKAAKVVVAGLEFTARYQSTKLSVGGQAGTSINQRKRPTHIAFLLSDSVKGALEYGSNFEDMDRLADRNIAQSWDSGPGLFSGETDQFTVPGGFDRDPRICIRATSRGGPVTVQGLVLGMHTNDRV